MPCHDEIRSPCQEISTNIPTVGRGIANGTFGELLQGALPGVDNNFLITLPVARFSRAVFKPDPNSRRVDVVPETKEKSRQVACKTLEIWGSSLGGTLTIESELPEGKGMASSSADMVATVRAVLAALGRSGSPQLTMELLRGIEPTDGVMYQDSVAFFHRKVQLCRRLGYLPRLHVVAIDEGGTVDTIEYNQKNLRFETFELEEYRHLLEQATKAFSKKDWGLLGQVSTRSAELNQRRNPKKHFDEVREIGRRFGAIGVAATHSGPCLGLLFAPHNGQTGERMREAKQALCELPSEVMHLESLPEERQIVGVNAAVPNGLICC